MDNRILATLHGIDGALARAGVPSMSAFWQAECERFYTHSTARLLVECVGRGGDKSRTSVMMAIAETLAGDFRIPPGERHYFTHVSENRDEAAKTLGVLEQYLLILSVPFTRRGDTIDLNDAPRGFKVLACRVGAVSGFRCFGWTADECAKWDDQGADPSAEVVASIKAMTVTHPSARGRIFSSPLATQEFFFETWATGSTPEQLTGHAASWQANPSISEESTHQLEPNEAIHKREYGAVAGSGSVDAVTAEEATAMVRALPSNATPLGAPVALIDSSSGRNDGWAFAIARYVHDGARRVLGVTELGAFEGKFADSMSFETIVEHVASVARRHHTSRVFGDQYLAFALQSEFAKHGLAFAERAWSQPSKIEALATLRRMARERSIVLPVGPEGDACRRELLSLREVLLPSKVFTVQSRRTGRGHADRANLVLLLARLVAEGDVWGAKSPLPNGPRDASRFMPIRSQFGRGAGTTMEPPRNQAQLQPSRGAFSWTPNNRRKSPFQNW